MPRFGWRWLLGLSSIPCFTALLLYGFVVESPRYLYMKGRISEAHNVLKHMATVNQTKLPSGSLVSEHTTDQNLASLERLKLLSDGIKETAFFKNGFSSVLMLFSSNLIKTTLLLWVVYFGNAFSYYGIILLTSELVSEQSKCGVPLHALHLNGTSLYRDVLITSFAGLFFIYFNSSYRRIFHSVLSSLPWVGIWLKFLSSRAAWACSFSYYCRLYGSKEIHGIHVCIEFPFSLPIGWTTPRDIDYNPIVWSSDVLDWNIYCSWYLLPRGKHFPWSLMLFFSFLVLFISSVTLFAYNDRWLHSLPYSMKWWCVSTLQLQKLSC